MGDQENAYQYRAKKTRGHVSSKLRMVQCASDIGNIQPSADVLEKSAELSLTLSSGDRDSDEGNDQDGEDPFFNQKQATAVYPETYLSAQSEGDEDTTEESLTNSDNQLFQRAHPQDVPSERKMVVGTAGSVRKQELASEFAAELAQHAVSRELSPWNGQEDLMRSQSVTGGSQDVSRCHDRS